MIPPIDVTVIAWPVPLFFQTGMSFLISLIGPNTFVAYIDSMLSFWCFSVGPTQPNAALFTKTKRR